MFTILIRKMLKTRWMVLCMFIGFLMAAGMMSTVPIYMDASLQRMLVKDMEQYQLDSGKYPGVYSVLKEMPAGVTIDSQLNMITALPSAVSSEVSNVKIPVRTSKTIIQDNMLYLVRGTSSGSNGSTRVKVAAMNDIEDHIEIISGTMYSPGGIGADGVYEVIISETAMRSLQVICGNEYNISPVDTSRSPFTVRITGVYQQTVDNDTYWSETMAPYINAVFTDFDCFANNMITASAVTLSQIEVRYNLDYQQMDMNDISSVTEEIANDFSYYGDNGYTFEMGVSNILNQYTERASKLTNILWVLQIPTMVMLAFYLFMVSQLNVEQERNEISVLKSRGASSKQIFGIYAAEAGILGLVSLVIAPFIGLGLCSFLGVSNGFLEFVNRTGIAAKVTTTAVLYALLAIVVFFLTTMLPIIPASKLTIVQYKQSKTKVVKMALWEKCCFDIVLILGSLAFLYIYNTSVLQQQMDGTFVANGELDPLLFIFSTCLVMGLGLLFIRLYPYLIRLIYMIGKLFWSPSQYIALTSISRSQGGKERFLMLFLVVTFSFGIFSANTARTINNNIEDKIYYDNGADVTVMEYWTETTANDGNDTSVYYAEKDFSRYENLAGVELATKVMKNERVRLSSSGVTMENATLMAIEPDKFAQTAWFRNDLLPVHWWNYTNALVDYKSGVIMSSTAAAALEAELGDEISLKWSNNDYVTGVVLAIVDYWPGLNPNELTSDGTPKGFVVMNYNYIYNATKLEPYEVWLKLSDDATSEMLYADISEKRLPIETLKDSSQMLIEEKNAPELQGMNGALTLGFIIIMIMTVIGFLIYWILSIKTRTLQFGILRAMGVTFKEIIGIIGYEQLLVSGVSIAMAFVIGGICSDLFVPLFQNMYDVIEQIPPFRVSALGSDYIKIYAIIVIMLGGGFAVLGRIIKKINVNKALKLGED